MSDTKPLTERLEIKTMMIQMGELIAYGSDSGIMHEAVAALKKLAAERDALLDRLEKAEKDAAVAIGMLADWCVAVDQNGTGWDDWDEHYKDAMYRPCPIREQLDEAIKVSQEERQ